MRLLDGEFEEKYDDHYIIDCRFPYEFEGGHIDTAININTMDALEELFFSKLRQGRRAVIVFHCEFSSQRAPRMYVV